MEQNIQARQAPALPAPMLHQHHRGAPNRPWPIATAAGLGLHARTRDAAIETSNIDPSIHPHVLEQMKALASDAGQPAAVVWAAVLGCFALCCVALAGLTARLHRLVRGVGRCYI